MEWNQFVSKILAFSKVGIKYSQDPYALENYHELEALATLQITEQKLIGETVTLYPKEAYPTPNVSVRIIIFNEKGQLLMVQEAQDHKFAPPGGWCDVFESPKENALKEVKQETGLDAKIDRLLGVFMRDNYKERATMVSEYCMYFQATVIGGTLQHNHELVGIGYYDLDDLPVLSGKTSHFELHTALSVALNKTEPYVD